MQLVAGDTSRYAGSARDLARCFLRDCIWVAPSLFALLMLVVSQSAPLIRRSRNAAPGVCSAGSAPSTMEPVAWARAPATLAAPKPNLCARPARSFRGTRPKLLRLATWRSPALSPQPSPAAAQQSTAAEHPRRHRPVRSSTARKDILRHTAGQGTRDVVTA